MISNERGYSRLFENCPFPRPKNWTVVTTGTTLIGFERLPDDGKTGIGTKWLIYLERHRNLDVGVGRERQGGWVCEGEIQIS